MDDTDTRFSGFFGTYKRSDRDVKNFKRMKKKKNLNYELKARREAERIL